MKCRRGEELFFSGGVVEETWGRRGEGRGEGRGGGGGERGGGGLDKKERG